MHPLKFASTRALRRRHIDIEPGSHSMLKYLFFGPMIATRTHV